MTTSNTALKQGETIYQVQLPYATCGIIANGNKITEAAPLVRWMIGKTVAEVRAWVERKGGKLV